MEDIKQQARESYKEKFGWSDNYWLDDPQLEWLDSILDLAVAQERERIIDGIDRMERDCVCTPLQTEICYIEKTFRRTQHRIINLINNN